MAMAVLIVVCLSIEFALSSKPVAVDEVTCSNVKSFAAIALGASSDPCGFLCHFWNADWTYLYNQWPHTSFNTSSLSHYWIYATGADAVVDGIAAGVVDLSWAESLYSGQLSQGYNADYFDDEWWMGNMLLDIFLLANSSGETALAQSALSTASSLLDDIMVNGWDETCCGEIKGGIWWDKAHSGKATASNMGPVILAARMAQITGNQTALAFAVRAFTFWRDLMFNRATGQIADFIQPTGFMDDTVWSYDQGLVLGAGVHLTLATNDESHLSSVAKSFDFLLRNLTAPVTGLGNILAESHQCSGDCEEFKGPTARYVADYYSVTKDQRAIALLKSSANAIWTLARNPSTNVFSIPWAGPAPSSADVVDQATQSAAIAGLLHYARVC